jgi:hypothetical protein
MLVLVLQNHPNRPLSNLWGIPAWSRHDPILSINGVSGKPGAVQGCKQLIRIQQISRESLAEWAAGGGPEKGSVWNQDNCLLENELRAAFTPQDSLDHYAKAHNYEKEIANGHTSH